VANNPKKRRRRGKLILKEKRGREEQGEVTRKKQGN